MSPNLRTIVLDLWSRQTPAEWKRQTFPKYNKIIFLCSKNILKTLSYNVLKTFYRTLWERYKNVLCWWKDVDMKKGGINEVWLYNYENPSSWHLWIVVRPHPVRGHLRGSVCRRRGRACRPCWRLSRQARCCNTTGKPTPQTLPCKHLVPSCSTKLKMPILNFVRFLHLSPPPPRL